MACEKFHNTALEIKVLIFNAYACDSVCMCECMFI